MPHWQSDAACRDMKTAVFFDDIWPEDSVREPRPEQLEIARDVCRHCIVRKPCLKAKLADEAGSAVQFRFGLVALLTPEQRHWLEKHGGELRKLDPIEMDIPDMGHDWHGRHTKLARRVLEWIVENVPLEQEVPGPQELHERLGVRRHDMHRVYKAFVEDGTLRVEQIDGNTRRYWRTGGTHGAIARWIIKVTAGQPLSQTRGTLTTLRQGA